MSTAIASGAAGPALTDLPHTPRAAHPIPLREQAFTLHCQGLRSPAIARDLGVPERTVRAWIAAALDELREDHTFSRREQLLIAVERQHALTAAAWQQFEAETAARTALLDAALAAFLPAASTLTSSAGAPADTTPATTAPVPHMPATTPAPRYLSLILQAHKETNRLLGLYTLARLDLLTPADFTEPASPANATETDHAATSATATPTSCASVRAAAPVPNPRPAAESATVADVVGNAAEAATGAAIPEDAAESATVPTGRTADSPASPRHDGGLPGPRTSRRDFTRRPSRRPILLARAPSSAS